LCPLSRPWQLDASDDSSFNRQAHNNFFSSLPASPVQTATAGADTDTDTEPAATFGSSAPATGGAAPAELGTPAKRDQKQDKWDPSVVAFHKSLDAEIKVRDNHHLPLLFASMLEHRAEKNTSFTIPKKEKWEDIRHRLGKGVKVKRDLLLALPGGLLEPVPLQPGGYWVTADDGSRYQVIERSCAALPFGYTDSPFLVLLDSRGRRYVHQGEVFGLLMAALLEAYTMKGLKEKVEKDYCNITTKVVDDFLRALDVCYYLAGVSAPAGSMRFDCVCPPPDHKAYMQSDYLQKVLPKVASSLSDARVNETTAERLKKFLARNTMAATANTGGIGKKRGREGAAGEGAAGEGAAGEGAADELRVRRLMGEHGISWGTVLALAEEYTNFTIPTKIKVA